MGKKRTKFDSVKKDPLLQQHEGLQFDNLFPDEVIELTDEQKATAFISRYLERERPISTYNSYFKNSAKGEAWELKELKDYFILLVASEKWSEEKFVAVVNSIYAENQIMSIPSLDVRGRMYDQGSLRTSGKKVTSRRRGRI